MEWTKPLSAVLVLLIALLAVGATVELLVTTFAIGDNVTESIVTMALVAVALLVAILAGARNRRWLQNPDSYW